MEKIRELNRGFGYLETSIKQLEKRRIAKSGLNITRRELTYIVIIGDNEGKTLSEIIGASGVTKGTISNQVKLLIKKGFVLLKRDEKDSRKKRVWLENLGRKVIEMHNGIRQEIWEKYRKVISEKEIDALIEVGRKILSFMKDSTNEII